MRARGASADALPERSDCERDAAEKIEREIEPMERLRALYRMLCNSSIAVAVLVAVRRGTQGHLGALRTGKSRQIRDAAPVLLEFQIRFPSWTSPVRPRSPALLLTVR